MRTIVWGCHLILFKIGAEDLGFKKSGLSMCDVTFCCSNSALNAIPFCGVAVNLSPACLLDCNMSLPLQGICDRSPSLRRIFQELGSKVAPDQDNVSMHI